jgi:flagellar L-ring protein FlgH
MKALLKFYTKNWILIQITVLTLLGACTVPASAASLWDEEANGARSMFTDRTAFRKGDLVTIVVNQNTSAIKDQSTETTKEVSVDENLSALIGPFMSGVRDATTLARRNPHNTWESSRSFEGSGEIENQESFTSTIQARVTDVLPNRVLRIEATRRVEVGQEISDLVLSGFVREQDLTTANSVLSTQVADLQVKQVTNGAISREQRKGWLTRIWEAISPF